MDAPPAAVWHAVLAACPGASPSLLRRLWAVAWGADPAASNGLAAHVIGAERPGFVVREVVPASTWAAAGQHRWASYQLVFRITPVGIGSSRLTAETYATFPRTLGRVYRAFLIQAGLHSLTMKLILRSLRRRAERAYRPERRP